MPYHNLIRNSLIVGIAAVTFTLFIRWNNLQEEANIKQKAETETLLSAPRQTQQHQGLAENTSDLPQAPINSSGDLPSTPPDASNTSTHSENMANKRSPSTQAIRVRTNSLDILIDPLGGDIVKVALPKFALTLDKPDEPFILLNRTHSHTYIAQSGLIGQNGTDLSSNRRPLFNSDRVKYEMREDQDTLEVDLYHRQGEVNIIKRYRFTRDSYLIDLDYLVDNQSTKTWQANLYGQIKRDQYKPNKTSMFAMSPYLGGAITTPGSNFKKISFDDLDEGEVKLSREGGWVAMIEHYFLSAWIPPADNKNHYSLRKTKNQDLYIYEFTSQALKLSPGQQGSLRTQFYAGPKDLKKLEAISPFLDLSADYGFLWFIAKPLFKLLDFIHGWVNNWGIAIILLTVLIKLFFLYPSAMSYRSMAKMRKVQPQMAALKERYGEDRQKMSMELMKLYKKEKVNPLGGCLPILIQMPVFIALYWVLMESVELRHAPFFLWIEDLSVKDPFFVLPLIMGLTMWIQQKLNPTPPDPMQAKIMQMMPIVFTFVFMMFPAGLVLYWVVNNTLSITQQYIITRQIEKA